MDSEYRYGDRLYPAYNLTVTIWGEVTFLLIGILGSSLNTLS